MHCTSSMPATNKVSTTALNCFRLTCSRTQWLLVMWTPRDPLCLRSVIDTNGAYRSHKAILSFDLAYHIGMHGIKSKGCQRNRQWKNMSRNWFRQESQFFIFVTQEYRLNLPINSCWSKLGMQTLKPTSMRLKKLDKRLSNFNICTCLHFNARVFLTQPSILAPVKSMHSRYIMHIAWPLSHMPSPVIGGGRAASMKSLQG